MAAVRLLAVACCLMMGACPAWAATLSRRDAAARARAHLRDVMRRDHDYRRVGVRGCDQFDATIWLCHGHLTGRLRSGDRFACEVDMLVWRHGRQLRVRETAASCS